MKLKLILSLVLFLGFSSLSHSQWIAQRALPTEKISFRPQTEDGGMIISSVTFPKERGQFNAYCFMVRAISDDKKTVRKNSQEFIIRPEQIFKIKHQGETDGGLTYLFIMKRPEGQYVINNVRLVTMGYGTSRSDNLEGFEIPVDVKKGEITYVGNIMFNEYAEVGEKIISLNNTYERDIKLAQLLQPYVIWKMAINNLDRKVIYK